MVSRGINNSPHNWKDAGSMLGIGVKNDTGETESRLDLDGSNCGHNLKE